MIEFDLPLNRGNLLLKVDLRKLTGGEKIVEKSPRRPWKERRERERLNGRCYKDWAADRV